VLAQNAAASGTMAAVANDPSTAAGEKILSFKLTQ
jgi:hypothetical protein